MTYFRDLVFASIVGILVVGDSAHVISAEQPGTATDNEHAVRQAGKAYVEALRRGDANALAAHWTAEGIYVDAAGNSVKARELIQRHFGQKAPPESTTHATVDPSSVIRFVTFNVAIEQGVSQKKSGADDTAPRYTAIWVNQDGGWLIDSLQEFESTSSAPVSRLDGLAWMIGDWAASDDISIVRCAASWSENKKFIMRRFTIERAGAEILHSTQRIGWDPATRKIRSWVFDSNGGIFEGSWRNEDDSWIVKTTGVLPSGDRSSAINFWIPEGPNQCVLKISHAMVGDVTVEDSVLEFKRSR